MNSLNPHPNGLAGLRAEIAGKVASAEAEFARVSGRTADRLRRQGREAVASYLANSEKVGELTAKDRAALAEFLVSHSPEDILRDAAARRMRNAFLRVEGFCETVKISPRVRRIAALAPLPILAAAVLSNAWTPLETIARQICVFQALSQDNRTLDYEFVRELTFAPPPSIFLIIAIAVIAAIGGFRFFIANAFLVGAILFALQTHAQNETAAASRTPAYCNDSDPRSNAYVPPTAAQIKHIRPLQK